MKVVYNDCFGGFGLSDQANQWLKDNKGIDAKYNEYNNDCKRTDPNLIAVIEALGDKANGMCADLAIAEIPDGSEYEIDSNGGNESVVPPRQSW